MDECAITLVELDDREELADAVHPCIDRRLLEVSITEDRGSWDAPYNNGVVLHVLSLLEICHEMHAYTQDDDARNPLQRKEREEDNTKGREGKG